MKLKVVWVDELMDEKAGLGDMDDGARSIEFEECVLLYSGSTAFYIDLTLWIFIHITQVLYTYFD